MWSFPAWFQDVCSTFQVVIFSPSVFKSFQFINLWKWYCLCSIKKHDSYDAPIKDKEELIFHTGFRQFIARHVYTLCWQYHLYWIAYELRDCLVIDMQANIFNR